MGSRRAPHLLLWVALSSAKPSDLFILRFQRRFAIRCNFPRTGHV